MGILLNSIAALVVAVLVVLVVRRGQASLVQDWRRGLLLFAVCYALLEVLDILHRKQIAGGWGG